MVLRTANTGGGGGGGSLDPAGSGGATSGTVIIDILQMYTITVGSGLTSSGQLVQIKSLYSLLELTTAFLGGGEQLCQQMNMAI